MRLANLLIVLMVYNSYGFAVTLTGNVTQSDNTPISGAFVLVRGTNITGVSAANGSYTLNNVPSGVFGLTCVASGFRGNNTGAINLTQNTTRNFVLNPVAANTYSISGVTSCDGAACGGILVLAYQGQSPYHGQGFSGAAISAYTTGNYVVEGLAAGTYSIIAINVNYLLDYLPDDTQTGITITTSNVTINLNLPKASIRNTVKGYVLMSDNPLDRGVATVSCNGVTLPINPTTTLPDGSYSLSDVPAGLLSFSAFSDGYNQNNQIDVLIKGDATLDFLLRKGNLPSTQAYDIDGTITLDSSGGDISASLAGSRVNVWTTDGSQHFSTVTDADGHYLIENLPTGSYQAGAAREGYLTKVEGAFNLTTNRTIDFQLSVDPTWDYGPGIHANLPSCSVNSSNNSLWVLILGFFILWAKKYTHT
jgi:hypothetical protein